MSDHTPTTDRIRGGFEATRMISEPPDGFDLWLTAHERKIATKTLREFADDPDALVPAINDGEFVMGINYASEYMRNLARTRADRIEQEGQS